MNEESESVEIESNANMPDQENADDSNRLRIQSAMILYALERSLGSLVRRAATEAGDLNPNLLGDIQSREDERPGQKSTYSLDSAIEASYLHEIFRLAIDLYKNDVIGDRLKDLLSICEQAGIYDIRNAVSHPNKPFPKTYWYRAAVRLQTNGTEECLS